MVVASYGKASFLAWFPSATESPQATGLRNTRSLRMTVESSSRSDFPQQKAGIPDPLGNSSVKLTAFGQLVLAKCRIRLEWETGLPGEGKEVRVILVAISTERLRE